MEKPKSSDYAHAYIDADINGLLEARPDFVSGCDCVITMLDSGKETWRHLRGSINPAGMRQCGAFAVLSGDLTLEKRQELFSGFDECYVFAPGSWRDLNPNLFSEHYTSERTDANESILSAMRLTFVESGALRYASDGVGLNIQSSQGTAYVESLVSSLRT